MGRPVRTDNPDDAGNILCPPFPVGSQKNQPLVACRRPLVFVVLGPIHRRARAVHPFRRSSRLEVLGCEHGDRGVLRRCNLCSQRAEDLRAAE